MKTFKKSFKVHSIVLKTVREECVYFNQNKKKLNMLNFYNMVIYSPHFQYLFFFSFQILVYIKYQKSSDIAGHSIGII